MMAYHRLLGKYIITEHAFEQYDKRVEYKSRDDLMKSIKWDLRMLNIRNIIRTETDIHVFTRGYKEFIFAKSDNILYLKTIIKRNMEDTKWKINKRQNLVTI